MEWVNSAFKSTHAGAGGLPQGTSRSACRVIMSTGSAAGAPCAQASRPRTVCRLIRRGDMGTVYVYTMYLQ